MWFYVMLFLSRLFKIIFLIKIHQRELVTWIASKPDNLNSTQSYTKQEENGFLQVVCEPTITYHGMCGHIWAHTN